MNKRGLSAVIITLIITLLVIVAIGIVWIVVRNIIEGEVEDMSLEGFMINLEIKNVYIEGENIIVNVKRNSGQGDLVGIKFIFYNNTDSEYIDEMIILKESEEKSFIFDLDILNLLEMKEISIAPIYKSGSGKEISGNIVDTSKIKEVEPCILNCTNRECGDNGCGGSCGNCSEDEECIKGICESWEEFCQDECDFENQKICSDNTSYKKCGNYDFDSCLEWSDNLKCLTDWSCEEGNCQYDFGTEQIIIGEDYDYYPNHPQYHDQATVEFVNVNQYREEDFVLEIDSKGHIIKVAIYEGEINLNQWWGSSRPLHFQTEIIENPSMRISIPPYAEFFSIVYISRPERDEVPNNLEITRSISIKEPRISVDWSRVFVTDFSTFPEDVLEPLENPLDFNDKMNLAYESMKDLMGEDSDALDSNGRLKLVVKDISYCGLAGNPIQMDPNCIAPVHLNNGDPAFGPVHELGHVFTCHHSYCINDGSEAWANFAAIYVYMVGVIPGWDVDYGTEYPFTYGLTMKEYWENVWDTPSNPHDVFQGLMVDLANEYSWDIGKNFFRKYIESDPAWGGSEEEKRKLAVRYLAESLRDITGEQEDYNYVVDYLVGRGFPSP